MAKQKRNATRRYNLFTFALTIIIVIGLFATVYISGRRTNLFSHADGPELAQTAFSYNVGYQVKTISYTLPSHWRKWLNIAIWYPTDAATQPFTYKLSKQTYTADLAEDAAPTRNGTPFPLIVFSHGLFGCGTQSVYLAWYWASQGYIVVAPDHEDKLVCSITKNSVSGLQTLGIFGKLYKSVKTIYGSPDLESQQITAANSDRANQLKPAFSYTSSTTPKNTISGFTTDHRPLDAKAVIDEMLSLNSDRRSPFYQTINPQEIGMAGHSLGGWTTAASLGGDVISPPFTTNVTDSRIKAGVMLAPYMYNAGTTPVMTKVLTPTMLLYGSDDTLAGSSSALFNSTNAPSYFAILQGATHFAFDDGQCVDYTNVKDCGDQDPLANTIRSYTTAFFNKYLKNDSTADTVLKEKSAQFATYEQKP